MINCKRLQRQKLTSLRSLLSLNSRFSSSLSSASVWEQPNVQVNEKEEYKTSSQHSDEEENDESYIIGKSIDTTTSAFFSFKKYIELQNIRDKTEH